MSAKDETWQVFAPFTNNLEHYESQVGVLTRSLAEAEERQDAKIVRLRNELAEAEREVELHRRAIELLAPLDEERAAASLRHGWRGNGTKDRS